MNSTVKSTVFVAVIFMLLFSSSIFAADNNVPKLDDKTKLELLTLQRDINSLSASIMQVSQQCNSEIQKMQDAANLKTQALQKLVEKWMVPGWTLDALKLEYVKKEEKKNADPSK